MSCDTPLQLLCCGAARAAAARSALGLPPPAGARAAWLFLWVHFVYAMSSGCFACHCCCSRAVGACWPGDALLLLRERGACIHLQASEAVFSSPCPMNKVEFTHCETGLVTLK